MKKRILFILITLIGCISAANAQYLINKTHYTPMNFTHQPHNINYANGDRFEGTAHYVNGDWTGTTGIYYYANGSKIESIGLDSNNRLHGNGFYTDEAGRRYNLGFQHGDLISKVDVTPNPTPVYTPVPGSSGGSTNSGSSDWVNPVDAHKAKCSGYNGTGVCGHCNGSGLSASKRSACSICNGHKYCHSCMGKGFIRL